MSKRLKVLVGLTLICGLSVSISACGGGGDSSSAAEGDRGEISGEIRIWDTEYEALPEYKEVVDRIDAEFEKLHPGTTVRREPQPLSNYESLVHAAFTAKEGPDIMLFQTGRAGVLNYLDGLESLNDLLSPEIQDALTLWSSGTPDFSEDGERYGVPIGVFESVFYYNKNLFEKAGLPREFEPQTWDEVRETGEKLSAAGLQPFAAGAKDGLENLYWFNVGTRSELNPDQRQELYRGEMRWTDPAVAAAFAPDFELQEAGLFPGDRFGKGYFEACGDFANGKAAMFLGFNIAACHWGEFDPQLGEKNVGFFLAPGSDVLQLSAGFVMSIPKFAANKEGAVALLEFEASKKGMQQLVDDAGFMPNRGDVQMPPDAPIQAREMVELQREMPTEPGSFVPGSLVFGPFGDAINGALEGRTSLEEAQETLQETVEATSR